MDESDWATVDVISCAAPNLRRRPGNVHNPEYGRTVSISDDGLYQFHLAYRDAIADYKQFFHVIEFAVYCREDETENYDAFSAGIT